MATTVAKPPYPAAVDQVRDLTAGRCCDAAIHRHHLAPSPRLDRAALALGVERRRDQDQHAEALPLADILAWGVTSRAISLSLRHASMPFSVSAAVAPIRRDAATARPGSNSDG